MQDYYRQQQQQRHYDQRPTDYTMTDSNAMYNNIPAILRDAPNWCITAPTPSGKLKIPANASGYASVTDPSTWMTFNEAVALGAIRNVPIGIVLTDALNVTCVDIDTGYNQDAIDSQPNPAAARIRYDFHQRLLSWLNRDTPTYTELSSSGYNYHVFIQGSIGDGIRLSAMTTTVNNQPYTVDNAGIEVYSRERFIVVTGNTVTKGVSAIANVDIAQLLAQAKARSTAVVLTELPATHDDDIVKAALFGTAPNATQATSSATDQATSTAAPNGLTPVTPAQAAHNLLLWEHQPTPMAWQAYEHPLRDKYQSQSDADCSLMIAIAKLTPSNDQVRRLFKQSGLGQRPKAVNLQNNYIERTLCHARGVIAHEQAQLSAVDALVQGLLAAHKPAMQPEESFASRVASEQSAIAREQSAKVQATVDNLQSGTQAANANNLTHATQVATTTAVPVASAAVRPINARGNYAPTANLPKLISTRKRTYGVIPNLDVTDMIGDWSMLDIGTEDYLDYPPGLAGMYARWVYSYSPQPMVEACITHTLALLAGIGGNTYKINPEYPTGINNYFILMSLSATGKDILHSGMGHLRSVMADVAPEVTDFIDHSRYKSEAAMAQGIDTAKYDSTVHLMPEFSKVLHSAQQGNANDDAVLSWMLPAYSYSTIGNIVGATRKSGFSKGKVDAETRSRANGFGYSMVGECTEGDLNKALNGGMLRDGRLSRFVCIRGDDYLQIADAKMLPMPAVLKDHLTKVIKRCTEDGYIMVHTTPDAKRLIDKYHHVMVEHLNNTRAVEDDPRRVVYNRARLKVWKIAGSLAMLECPEVPVITAEQVCYGLSVVNRDIHITTDKINNRVIGDGADDNDRVERIRELINGWIGMGRFNRAEHTRMYGSCLQYGIVPSRVLRESTKTLQVFKNPRTDKAEVQLLNNGINLAISEGFMRRISESEILKNYGIVVRGDCFQITGG